MLTPHRKALIDRLASAPDDVAVRAALYRDLLDTADAALDGVRVAAGLGDPAAMRVVAERHAKPQANRPRAWLPQLRGLPVDRLELSHAEPDWLSALAGLPLRTLVLDSPNFTCDQGLWQRFPTLALDTLEISGFSRTDNETCLPSTERLRRLKLHTYGDDFDDDFLRRLSPTTLQELTLNRCDEITDDGLLELSRLPLRSLELERLEQLSWRGMAHLSRHPLEHLSLGWGRLALLENTEWLRSLTTLRSLRLDYCYANEATLQAIRDLPIERLSLQCASVSEEDLAELEGMPLADLDLKASRAMIERLDTLHAFPLQRLGLSDVQDIQADTLGDLRGLALESLDLSLNEITGNELKQLAGLPLKHLNLSFCSGIDGQALRVLSELGLPLERLDLGGLNLRDADLACLHNLPLHTLSLYDSPWITDAGVAHLSGLPLRDLTLSASPGESQLTSAAVSVLEQLPLQKLWLANSSGIDADGWDRLARLPARVIGPGI
ncbi:leucine-rich repeat domain-containing protein [Pseudomonas vanderleydeniana]|uniref:Leucine-rich repeat domain-containing protein n=1 Tax=Pseudomonas vanderleydeniana TaxID=2745495 RepID=A0A9E6TQV2_9PSED|nr:leucine-rich repeat domain-containing protein [Pseudomonas vanderleydeniana]QXI27883.1 leucine-rich repeat domain-containing protein [Pseudomonas vanderleydeniana]